MSRNRQLPVVTAGGSGQRFGATSDGRPKWATVVRGVPLLSYIFLTLERARFERVVVLTRVDQIVWVGECQKYVPKLTVETIADGSQSQYEKAITALNFGVNRDLSVVILSGDMLADPSDLEKFVDAFDESLTNEIWCLIARQQSRTSATWSPVIESDGSMVRLEAAQGGFYERTALAIKPKTASQLLRIGRECRDNFGLGWTVTALIELARRSGMPVKPVHSYSLVANLNEPTDLATAELVVDRYFVVREGSNATEFFFPR